MSHEQILKLIEEVDPNDTAKLDEIDVMAFCYVYAIDYIKEGHRKYYDCEQPPQYTRSRDALKSIRPKGWAIDMTMASTGLDSWVQMHFMVHGKQVFSTNEKWLPTEELAELHAIIQAVAYERGLNG